MRFHARNLRLGAFLLPMMMMAAEPASAVGLQSDCRGPGSIGTATMRLDGTITLNIDAGQAFQGALAYKKDDPNYMRIFSHVGGIRPGERKPVPPFC